MSAQGLEDPRISALSEVSLQAFVAHRGGAIVYVNAGFCALFGFDRAVARGDDDRGDTKTDQ